MESKDMMSSDTTPERGAASSDIKSTEDTELSSTQLDSMSPNRKGDLIEETRSPSSRPPDKPAALDDAGHVRKPDSISLFGSSSGYSGSPGPADYGGSMMKSPTTSFEIIKQSKSSFNNEKIDPDGGDCYEETPESQEQALHPNEDNLLAENERWPTDDELRSMRRVGDKLPIAAIFIVLTEFCERFSYYGVTGPFQNYIQNPYRPGAKGVHQQPGAIGGGQQKATALSNFFMFWCYLTPILGAIIADQFLGKFKTIFYFSLVYIIGFSILTLTSIPASIRAGGALPGLVIAMIIIGLGTGGIKSNVSPMVAQQYTRNRPFVRRLKNGKEVLVDRDVTVQSIFNWFYWAINVGSLSAIATTELEHNVDFWAAYLLPTLMFIVCIFIFLAGKRYYVKAPPNGSILLKAFKAIQMAIKQYRIARKQNRLLLDENGKKVGFLEYAKPSNMLESGEMLEKASWDDTFINQLQRTLKACKVFVCYPVYWLCYGQMSNNLVSQAAQMNTGGIPNDIIFNVDAIMLIILIPLFDRVIYPGFRKIGMELKPIMRITLGFIFAAAAMAYAAIVQHLIYKTPPGYEYASRDGPNNITVAIQVPTYIMIAISEIFASITGLEYAYTKAPDQMKSIVMALFLVTNCGGSILGFAFTSLAKDPHLVQMFAIIAGIMGVFLVLFWLVFNKYDKNEHQENQI
ncbi:peptide transporter ptr2 [Mycoemilia scoparia]|uniref:Peptide transporter ptr2 n=1 Tax=Mycoemilia scoparia TaxID=417184 RepID=A0A9W7ZSF8_9FUNG|nr:peptide transporter ptr2 [Mycoemilia scoparia]